MNLDSPIFKMALSGLRKTMKESGIKKVIFYFDENENPQIENAPEELTVAEFQRIKQLNNILLNGEDEKKEPICS